jgi:hypothetical protein
MRHLPASMPIVFLLLLLLTPGLMMGQSEQYSCNEYGSYIFNMLIKNDKKIADEFVDLIDYTAYIDRIDKLPESEKDEIKYNASKSYTSIRNLYNKECNRILKLYKTSQSRGATFTYTTCDFKPSKNFPDIGFMTCYYLVQLPGEDEEEELDTILFECIRTVNGWRILDGFFDGEAP